MIQVYITLVYEHEPGKYNHATKPVKFPAVPRVGDYLSIDELEDERPVTEVHFDMDGGVVIIAEVREPEDLLILLNRGWSKR